MDKYKTNITQSRSGHYTVTVRINGGYYPRFKQRKLGHLQGARFAAEEFIREHKKSWPDGEGK